MPFTPEQMNAISAVKLGLMHQRMGRFRPPRYLITRPKIKTPLELGGFWYAPAKHIETDELSAHQRLNYIAQGYTITDRGERP